MHHIFAFYCSYSTFFLFILFLHIESAEAGIGAVNRTEVDRLALLAVKEKLTDGPLRVLSSWNNSVSFCKWQGVTCSRRHQRVTKLGLFSQGLVGTLSPHIGNLTFLRWFSLSNNSLHGKIPTEIGRLYRLERLRLDNNSFVGNIPANISGCPNLQVLILSYNEFEGKIPVELGSLSKLVTLGLVACNLTGWIPPFIGNLSSLQTVALYYNSFEGHIPNSLSQLNNLSRFLVASNRLSGTVPPSIYNISSLKHFDLGVNHLKGSLPQNMRLPNLEEFVVSENQFSETIPFSLFNASGLRVLDMGGNNFVGKAPHEVGNLKRLQHLALDRNRLGSGKIHDLDFLTTLTNCSNLGLLGISENQFGGSLPNSIANLSNQLSVLMMGSNQIHGSIPSGIQNYINLMTLSMRDNFFTGRIPFGLSRLQNLQALDLSGNRLHGKVPSFLGNASHLSILDLSYNILEGNIFSVITKSRFLREVYLSNNKFTGPIPEELTSSQLLILNLSHNSLIGSLPIQLGNFKNLLFLDVSENKISGEIPPTIGGCVSLQDLSLNENLFRGSIPASFIFLKDLRSLDLSKNYFSGEIPKNMERLPLLQNLNLSFNNLEGAIPTEGIFRNATAISIAGNSKLCGGIFELHLPGCLIQKSKKGKISSALKMALIVVSSVIVIFFVVVYLYWRTRPRTKPSLEHFPGNFERVSYQELHHATNGFSLANLIGVGSVSSVYKGILHEREGPVAVKVLSLITRGASKSFITECEALRKIRHRNLLKILTVCSSVDGRGNDFKALVLKFMPNGSLENCLHRDCDGRFGALSFLKRLNIAIDIASALDYLHNLCPTPIIHCDLKPSNILLDEDMTAHVGDFGLAKFLSKSTRNDSLSERTSTFPRGTLGYIPPEYGMGGEASTQGDVYSYGIILLEMFTGKRPTDNIFNDGLTLHSFSSVALPLGVMDIVDPQMPLEEHHVESSIAYQRDITDTIQQHITSIFKIGVACSTEAQSKRTSINYALMELHRIKEVFLGARLQRQIQDAI